MSWHIDENGTIRPVNVSNFPTTAYGELVVAEKTPMAQIIGVYGFTDRVFTATLGGNITNENSMFQVNTGVGPTSIAVISTDEQVACKGGQGLVADFSAIFDTGVANNTQFAGMQTSDALVGFGYNGDEFGIGFANRGALEIQELTITAGANNNENATITIDGNPYTVLLTNSTINTNAYEIYESLSNQVPGYSFSSNLATITCMGLLPQLGGGLFAFSSPTAAGVFVEKEASALTVEEWVPKANWNVNPNIIINPSLGNEYRVRYKHLGFGNIEFSIENPDGGGYEVVHIKKYANTSILPSVENPTFRVGWAVSNVGNTSNVTVQGAGAELSIEGKYIVHGQASGECNIQPSTSGEIQHVLSIRNRLTFNDKPNRANVELNVASVSTEATKITTFFVYKNAIPADSFTWEYKNEQESIVEFAKDVTIINTGEIIDCRPTRVDAEIDLSKLIKKLKPMEYLTIGAIYESGSAADVSASVSFNEDL